MADMTRKNFSPLTPEGDFTHAQIRRLREEGLSLCAIAERLIEAGRPVSHMGVKQGAKSA